MLKKLLQAVKADKSRTEDTGRVMFLEGEGGIGKSRVLEEFMDIAEDEDFRYNLSLLVKGFVNCVDEYMSIDNVYLFIYFSLHVDTMLGNLDTMEYLSL